MQENVDNSHNNKNNDITHKIEPMTYYRLLTNTIPTHIFTARCTSA